jgi:hypothetical protein
MIILKGKNIQYYYTLIDNIYVSSSSKEEEDIKDRKKIIETLTS